MVDSSMADTSIKAISQFILATQQAVDTQDLAPSLAAMQVWRDSFFQSLEQHELTLTNFNPQGEIAQYILQIRDWQEHTKQASAIAYTQLSAAQDLMKHFEQRVMLLLFGKFNAGKSSLCNVIAECFRQHHQAVQYFYLEAGQIVFTEAALTAGATETTARLQGVCLGNRLVLLDTPGLHSITTTNAALTQRFLESADGILWLTSSSSPGQVQELDGLAQELVRNKPLLPVITRSDYLEEDEIDGDIVQVLCNKPASQRQLQEQDVQARATEKLIQMQVAPNLLKLPISISAYALTQANFSDEAIKDSGFERLFSALLDLIQPALAYKQRKPAEILLHYLQEHILTPFNEDFNHQLHKLHTMIDDEIISLASKKGQVIQQVWRAIVPTLPRLFEKHYPLTTVVPLLNDICDDVNIVLPKQITHHLTNSMISPEPWTTLPLIGALTYHATENELNQIVINEEQLYKTICDSLRQALMQTMDNLIKDYSEQLQQFLKDIATLKSCLGDYQQQLTTIANKLRA